MKKAKPLLVVIWVVSVTVVLTALVVSAARFVRETTMHFKKSLSPSFNITLYEADARFKALDAARSSAPCLSDFVRLFPGAEVNYRHFSATDQCGFDLGIDLHGRYRFTMRLPVILDAAGQTVTGYEEAQFHLQEVKKQEEQMTFFNKAGDRKFSSAEWQKVVESGGDFGAIGYAMVTNKPIAGYRDRNKRQ